MKNLFIVLLLTMSSTAYCNGSWTPEDIRQGLSADILKDSGKLNSVVDNLPKERNDKYKLPEAWKEAEKIMDTTDTPEEEEIITGYNAAMLKDPKILRSMKGHVYGAYSTIVAFQEYNLLSEETCISKLTDEVLKDALNKIHADDFLDSDGLKNATVVTALLESYQCNVGIKVPEKDKAIEDILSYVDNISVVDYVTGMVNTFFTAQDTLFEGNLCMSKSELEEFTIVGMVMDTLKELDAGDIPGTNVGRVVLVYNLLHENYPC